MKMSVLSELTSLSSFLEAGWKGMEAAEMAERVSGIKGRSFFIQLLTALIRIITYQIYISSWFITSKSFRRSML